MKHPDCDAILSRHSRSLLAQFGLTPKSRRGLAAREVVEQPTVLHYGISARPSLRAFVSDFVTDFAPLACFRLRRLYLMELRSTRKPRERLAGERPPRYAERQRSE